MHRPQTIEPTESALPQRLSAQMKAVLAIFTADTTLMSFIGTAVDFKRDSIDWNPIFSHPLSFGQRAAALWAYSIWVDDMRDQTNIFEASLSMDAALQSAVLRAFRLRWGLHS